MIQDSFLEPEVRAGFYVPSEVKQAWAAELEVLQEIDRICKKHDILYFADWGTLLGAVRHGGFIPWDDDLDITMKRADYERFLQVAKKEMRDDFALFTYATHPNFWSFMARFVAKNKICFEEEHLKRFHGFPYIVGIDIFVLDYVSTDKEKEEERCSLARYVIAVADAVAEGRLRGKKAKCALDKIEQRLHIRLYERADLHALRVQLYRAAEKLFAMFSDTESQEVTRMMPNGLYVSGTLQMKKEYYDKQIWLPFEDVLLPVPSGYDEMLRKRYGDYMKLARNEGGHDYPFFETQRKQLQAVLDFEMPGYKYTGIAARDAECDKSSSLKVVIRQGYEKLCEYTQLLSDSVKENDGTLDMELLGVSQQLAIEMGNLVETCKGEGQPIVSILEIYCEVIYQLSQNYAKEYTDKLQALLFELGEAIHRDILERKTVVFLPYKASEWDYMQSVWQAAMEDEACDVYVIPIPYFYKEYDGALRDMQYEAEQFPKHVSVAAYDTFEFALHYPDVIYIQNPYDEFNAVMSVHTFFYSANLKHYTENLIYIPPFTLEEFSKENYREYFNMKYYCTMPGVVNADKVLVQSENMKQLYVEKLTEFAGDVTREIWEEKIIGMEALYNAVQNLSHKNIALLQERILEKWWNLLEREDGSCKKVMLYYTGLSSFIQYREQMLVKMRENFQIFLENQQQVVVIWKTQSLIRTTMEQLEPELYRQYCLIEREFCEQSYGIMAQEETDDMLAAFCDAYYGDASPLAQKCQNAGKPVMLQNYEVSSVK